ncbi:MAG: hypothetical protein Q4P23_11745 [Micrococcaceae bacterium]|nr:hypothetical protein [Micrococcaceae bacterium]
MKRYSIACAASAGVMFSLALIVVKGDVEAPLAGIAGGLVIAAPLIAAALMPGRRQ